MFILLFTAGGWSAQPDSIKFDCLEASGQSQIQCPLHLYSAGRVSSGRAANTIEDKNLLKSLSPARVAELSNDS